VPFRVQECGSNVSIEGKASNCLYPTNCAFNPIGGAVREFVDSVKNNGEYRISFKVLNGVIPERIDLDSSGSVIFSMEFKTYTSKKKYMIYLSDRSGKAISDTLELKFGVTQFKNVNFAGMPTSYHSH
jgi:hypothetical protein